MTDRELLELAAKAAGIVGEYKRIYQTYGDQWVNGIDTGARFFWNPLVDDGDALRLAVKLHLHLGCEDNVANAWPAGQLQNFQTELHGIDSYAATRRAITRAAAEIGKAKS